MKILAIAKVYPQTTVEKIKPHMEAEVLRAWELYKGGRVREMYACADRRLGVVFMLECENVDEAREILSCLPFVREKFIEFEFIPLGPFSYFESLFKDSAALSR